MKLINATPSPYGRKVAIALKEKHIPYEVQYDIPWVAETIVGQYSPLQQLPILLPDDGRPVYDSAFILDWLELHYPQPALLPSDIDAKVDALEIRLLGERLMEVASFIVFELKRPDPSAPWLARQSEKMKTGLIKLAELVGDRAPAPGEAITLGDIAVGSTLCMFEFMIGQKILEDLPEFQWRALHPNLDRYIRALEARSSFIETRPVMFVLDLAEMVS